MTASTNWDINWTRALITCLKLWRSEIKKELPSSSWGTYLISPLLWCGCCHVFLVTLYNQPTNTLHVTEDSTLDVPMQWRVLTGASCSWCEEYVACPHKSLLLSCWEASNRFTLLPSFQVRPHVHFPYLCDLELLPNWYILATIWRKPGEFQSDSQPESLLSKTLDPKP